MVFWYIARIIIIGFLFPFACSSHSRIKIEESWGQLKRGFDYHVMSVMKDKRS
jgi:hypothetical protein